MATLPVLIVGGSGKTGARVDARLRKLGIATRPVSRSTGTAFDWARRGTWRAALDGVSRAYVTYQPDLAVDGAADAIAAFGRLARDSGVERVVLLSGRGEPGAQAAEAALQASGVPWTVVRASWFNQNFSEGYLVDSVRAGEIALPAGAVPEPFVDADDIADVAVAALTDARHANRLYELTGPRALTFAEAADEIARAAGRPVRYRRIAADEFAFGMREAGVPEDIVTLLDELFSVVLDGRNSRVMHGVDEALGRPARDFADYARTTAATGVWSA
ncbi:NmrA family NAD(P)-binding protein [Burkholderia ubonensis]|uniref:NmrA family transcriptional regulator n=1 Tax=Burkholderia ubonensis subsp. mesacidophila TaxID=265293 RepID=A0A2A4FDK0_9BURK|nr:NmrA family NAD(P)-binding protein [Burkholderia ubonensis]PCE30419.1 NmrA family transcriptional regulator [Burkholderia ubonensis subsp. mesacidophila]